VSYFYAVQDSRQKTGTRVFCKKCQKETAFFRSKCLECGTAFVKKAKGSGKRRTFKDHYAWSRKLASIRDEKIAHYKRQAEESRKKFEGK